ncbi:von Willebrand factor type A [Gloeothece citriformis PCC 7424]|uniref:von Willebrand factor type A n=1 Tax=Gloeothece citriformis (strain PCC 7424) TaxID=65393 RepID=B7KI68_GLOC7|nr:VWA domain-containing protein [Gloeothece citriformis]ACK73555.1 von Willebrand factor type A [Gloeothece citriformis PCC 7424]
MRVQIRPAISDRHVDANQTNTQRQFSLAICATGDQDKTLPLNLCLVLDHSGSMAGKPLETVKQAAIELVKQLNVEDRLSIIAFDHRAKVLVPNQGIDNLNTIIEQINSLKPAGGTAIDEGLKLGIQESANGKKDRVSQIFLLTDGENEHGDNERCLKLAHVASDYNITLNTLGFGNHWNQDVLEKISDSAGGTLCYIETPDKAIEEFSRLFNRAQSIGLTNAHLIIDLMPQARLAELKPIAQVEPETVELTVQSEGDRYSVRLGDLMIDQERVILINLYLSQLSPGLQTIGKAQVRFDDPALSQTGILSEAIPLTLEVQKVYQPQPNDQVRQSILTLAKYRQTQIAEEKLKAGDRQGAATLLQTAAKTALQLGDQGAATILQTSATRLQMGEDLSEADRKKTRIVAKTRLVE